MDIDFSAFDNPHLLGKYATHPPAPCSTRHAAQANPRDTTGYRCGLRLAWRVDHSTFECVQLPFL